MTVCKVTKIVRNCISKSNIFEIWRVILENVPSKHLLVQDALKTSWRRPQRNNFLLQDVLENENCYAEDVLKTSWRNLLKTSSRHTSKTSLRPKKYLQGRIIYLYLTNLILHLANLYLANLYLTNLWQIQDKSKKH